MSTIRVAFRDFWDGFEPEHWFRRHPLWTQGHEFELSDHPDLVIHSCFDAGRAMDEVPLIDEACTRLFYTVANTPIDLSRTDFAIGPERGPASPRYLHLPGLVDERAFPTAPAFADVDSGPRIEAEREFAARVCEAVLAGRRWFWLGSRPDGTPSQEPTVLHLGPRTERPVEGVHVSSDPLDQPHVVDDEVDLSPLADGSVHRIEAPGLCLQWAPDEAIEVLERWRRPLAPDGRLSLATPDWEYCRRRAVDDPDGAFSALFAHGSRRAPRWGWRASDLERSLEEAGFASVDVRPFGAELRVRAWPRACAHEQESDRDRDLLVAWPHYEETELTLLLETVFATRPPGLRLVLRHDPTRDGLEAGAVATLKRAARNLGCGLGSDDLEVDLVSGSWAHLCPFEIGERTLLSIVTDPADPDRRRFIASLGAPSARLTEFESGLRDRRAAS